MKKHIAQPEQLLDINTVISNKIQVTDKGISIGAAVKTVPSLFIKIYLKNFH